MKNPMLKDKRKVLKALETVLKNMLSQIPGVAESKQKHMDKVIESFIEYCGKAYSTRYILDNMYPAQKASALFREYMELQAGKRKVH